uniref:BVpp30b protein n=1 Tax=Chelonus inanitus TaxID=49201 RepID=D7FB40_9HYME|nr:BVpp30b protein [Chelonus inanitus]
MYREMFPLYFNQNVTKNFLIKVAEVMEDLFDIKIRMKNIDKIAEKWLNEPALYKSTFTVYNKSIHGFSYDLTITQNDNIDENYGTEDYEVTKCDEVLNDINIITKNSYFGAVIQLFHTQWSRVPGIYYLLVCFYEWGAFIVAENTTAKPNLSNIDFMSSQFGPILVYSFREIFDKSLRYVRIMPNIPGKDESVVNLNEQRVVVCFPFSKEMDIVDGEWRSLGNF